MDNSEKKNELRLSNFGLCPTGNATFSMTEEDEPPMDQTFKNNVKLRLQKTLNIMKRSENVMDLIFMKDHIGPLHSIKSFPADSNQERCRADYVCHMPGIWTISRGPPEKIINFNTCPYIKEHPKGKRLLKNRTFTAQHMNLLNQIYGRVTQNC